MGHAAAPTQPTEVGPALALDELAADNMLALFGRAEARDFVDVYRLRARYDRADTPGGRQGSWVQRREVRRSLDSRESTMDVPVGLFNRALLPALLRITVTGSVVRGTAASGLAVTPAVTPTWPSRRLLHPL